MTQLIDYGRLDGIGLVGVETNDRINYDFILKSNKDADEDPKRLGVVSLGTVGIMTFENATRTQVAEAFSKALTTPNVLEATTRQTLREHHNWEDLRELVNRSLPQSLHVS